MGRPKGKRPFPKYVGEQKAQSVATNITPPVKVPPPEVKIPQEQSKFSIPKLTGSEIRNLISQKWEDSLREKYAKETRAFDAILKGIRDNIYTGNVQAVSESEFNIYINELDVDTLTFNKLIPDLNRELAELEIMIIRGSFGFGDGVSVMQIHIKSINWG